MAKLCSTKYLLVRYDRECLVCHHSLKYFSFKSLLRLYKRVVIPSNLSNVRKLPPCVAFLFGKFQNRPWSTKVKFSGGSIRNTLDIRPRAMKYIDQIISAQLGIISQVIGVLTHARFWVSTVFLDH